MIAALCIYFINSRGGEGLSGKIFDLSLYVHMTLSKVRNLPAQGRARVAGAVEAGTGVFVGASADASAGAGVGAIRAWRRSISSSFSLFHSSSLSFSLFFSL